MRASAPAGPRGFVLAWVATLAVAALLLVPLPLPLGGAPALILGFPSVDKLVHLLLFLALGWIWQRALARGGRAVPYLAVFAAAVAYGGVLELLQHASGLRTAEWGDLAADALGAGLVPLWRRPRLQAGRSEVGVEPGAGAAAGAELAPGPADSR